MRQTGYQNLAYEATPMLPLLKKTYFNGGYSEVNQVAITDEISNVVDIITGYETLNRVNAAFLDDVEWRYTMEATSVVVTLKDERDNASKAAQLIDLLDAKTKITLAQAARRLERSILNRQTTPTVFRGVHSFDGTVDTTGFFEQVVPASQVNTPGGLDRATAEGWRHPLYDGTSGGGTFSANGIDIMDQAIQYMFLWNEDGVKPMNMVCSTKMQRLIKKLYIDQVRFTSRENPEFVSPLLVMVNGAKVVPSTYLGFTAVAPANVISAYAWAHDAVELRVDKPLEWTGRAKTAQNQELFAIDYVWRGQLKLNNPRATALFINCET
jgi:hypothetical protein